MLQNAYLVAKIGADTAENERTFAEKNPQKLATTLRVHCPGRASAWSSAQVLVGDAPAAAGLQRGRVEARAPGHAALLPEVSRRARESGGLSRPGRAAAESANDKGGAV